MFAGAGKANLLVSCYRRTRGSAKRKKSEANCGERGLSASVLDGGPGREVRPDFAAPATPRAGEGSRLVHTREVRCLVALRVCGSRATCKD